MATHTCISIIQISIGKKGQWEFTRYLDTYASKVHKTRDVEAGANELHLEMNVSGFPSLDDIGDEDPDNHILSWADMTDPGSHQQVIIIRAPERKESPIHLNI